MGTRRSKEDDWTEVTRKNRGYRTKEDDLVKVHSNADLTRTISKSIFVTNFPDNTTSADLWNICQTYGVVVDVYIPNRRSKVGKRFAFVRFIKVTNVERLVGNLCTLWIGRMHLHANVVRFERTPFQQSQPPPPTRPGKIAPSFVSAVKGILPTPVLSPPAMVLDDSCMVTTDLRNYVMGEVKLFSSVNNLRVILSAEGFSIQKVVYLGGLWVMFELPSANSKSKFLAHVGVGSWFKSLSNPQPDFSPRDRIIWVDVEGVPMHAWSSNTFHKIGSMWGEVLELGDCKDECFARKRLCIKTNRDDNILEKFKIIVKGKSFVVRAKELFVWSPSFVEVTEADDIHEEGEFIQIGEEGLEKPIHQTNVEEESDIEAVSETFFGDQADDLNEVVDSAQQSIPKENSYDPFNIYDILNKENKDVNAAATNSSIPFPPGFTPDKPDTDVDELVAQKDQFQPDVKSVGSSSHTVESANNVTVLASQHICKIISRSIDGDSEADVKWVKQDKPNVYITLTSLTGTKGLQRACGSALHIRLDETRSLLGCLFLVADANPDQILDLRLELVGLMFDVMTRMMGEKVFMGWPMENQSIGKVAGKLEKKYTAMQKRHDDFTQEWIDEFCADGLGDGEGKKTFLRVLLSLEDEDLEYYIGKEIKSLSQALLHGGINTQ
ncbi:RNA-directed DNA polymerase, eukaryota [Tanacetum coccineum]